MRHGGSFAERGRAGLGGRAARGAGRAAGRPSRLLDYCAADPRVRWLVIGCSLGRAAADRLSDLDLGAGLTSILDYAPGRVAGEMAATVAGREPAALLAAARQAARLLGAAGAGLGPELAAALPGAMARYITADLASLADMGAPARA